MVSRSRRLFWLFLVLATGGVAMALEISAVRLFAPTLGTSIQIWGALISVVLAAMALGAVFGGWLVDRAPQERWLFTLIAGGGLYQLLGLYFCEPLLDVLRTAPELWATVIASVFAAGVPTVPLAAVGPFVVGLAAVGKTSFGRTAGWVYASGTLGSIGGVLLATFVLLPRCGTRMTLVLLGVTTTLLAALGFASLLRSRHVVGSAVSSAVSSGAILVIGGSLVLGADPFASKPAPRVLWIGESVYHSIRVMQLGRLRALVLDREDALHTAIDLDGRPTGAYWDAYAAGPILARGRRVLVLGMGAGAILRSVRWTEPEADIDAVEIDEKIVALARTYFDLDENARLRVHIGDARTFVRRLHAHSGEGEHEGVREGESEREREREGERFDAVRDTCVVVHACYDLVQIDVFRGHATIPFHLVTIEFYRELRDLLNRSGVLMINVFDASAELHVVQTVVRTLAENFPSTFVYSDPNAAMNHIVFAFPERRGLEDVRAELESSATSPAAAPIVRQVARTLRLIVPGPEVRAMTDDLSNIEEQTARMIRGAVISRRLPSRRLGTDRSETQRSGRD